ncbi:MULTISPECIES: CPBP family intramembrane glutamic endopeptidase [Pontibacillus]|uniref:CPBP family intramembrane metalloprotease n=1 Tax=Pontibacillus chungwhensis TaxID=265426 RepID=A0ABY8UUJ3_9BACI|nr:MULTISPECIES: CPBP family intramembrane glutamic endopeptidase [Pontibacillus]MCD5323028.1 CPBP family intramembrane metalloprotease [Pontibacillus sp. HN14]WIF96421.1 CPBP family intramembrane metalloprotease [Pontibacillus chungwhensis]
MKQAELIQNMTDRQVVTQLYITQLLILLVSLGSSLYLFDGYTDWYELFQWDLKDIFYYGGSAALFILLLDVLLMKIMPKRFYDDGGINEKVFRNLPLMEIFALTFFVACAEELLFRGIIQTEFGYLAASIIFALVHIRYLNKPVLFVSVLAISFYIGWMYEITGNLWVTIFAHFLIDLVLGIMIRYRVMR